MADDFLGMFMGSLARAKLLRVFFFDQSGVLTVAKAAKRAGITPKVALKEIVVLEHWGILKLGKFTITLSNNAKKVEGKPKDQSWTVDSSFKYAAALSRFVHEVSPAQHKDILIALRRTGRLATIILSGLFVGDPSRPADLVVAGDRINERRLEQAIRALEPQLGREIRYATFSTPEFLYRLTIQDRLVRETLDYPHLVLLDTGKLF